MTGKPSSGAGRVAAVAEEESVAPSGWTRGGGWGWVWGGGDEVGALNAVDAGSRLRALRHVQEGRVFDLGVTIDRDSFGWSGHVGTEVVAYRSPEGLLRDPAAAGLPRGGVSFRTSMVVLSDHAGTQLDGLCHATFGDDYHWYNGYRVDPDMGDFGPTRAGAHNIPPIIVPGVLIDVPGFLGVDELPGGFAVGPELLMQVLESQRIGVQPGDAVLVRSGNMRHWNGDGHGHDDISAADTSGINLAAARWLVEDQGAILVASDTSTLEVVPAVDGDCYAPVHKYLLVDQGVHMGELHDLEELSRTKTYRFCYIALSPKVRGTTAGFAMRPIALV